MLCAVSSSSFSYNEIDAHVVRLCSIWNELLMMCMCSQDFIQYFSFIVSLCGTLCLCVVPKQIDERMEKCMNTEKYILVLIRDGEKNGWSMDCPLYTMYTCFNEPLHLEYLSLFLLLQFRIHFKFVKVWVFLHHQYIDPPLSDYAT